MTSDQKLDEQAEARIREACPRHKIRTISNTIASEDFDLLAYPCTCPVQRAAILADREARETDESEEVEVSFGDLLDKWSAERAHADDLAEMVRVLLDELDAYRSRERACPCCDGHAPPYEDAETYHADDCSWVQADKLLAEHHRRRS